MLLAATALLAPPVLLHAQSVDPALARFLDGVQAIDNHAHPVLPPPGDAADRRFDALPVDNMEPQTDPVALRPDNPQLAAAWAALWGLHAAPPLDAAGLQALAAARAAVKQRQGPHYDEWVLARSGIGQMLANRVSLGPGIAPPHFRWVPYVDALLFPLSNTGVGTTPDRKQFFALEDHLRAEYLQAAGLNAVPGTLQQYLAQVVTPTLERQHAQGAVAEKFEVAYLRSFRFGNPSQADAARVYEQWAKRTDAPDAEQYKLLQDFLFRYIAAECGRLGMAVHLHTMSGGGSYFDIAGADPMLLEPVFDDPRLRGTTFVMLHGGWPFVREAGALLQKPNVYLDISQQSLMLPPRTLATWLREWLETFPDKVMFATDGYPYSNFSGWEESTWMASQNARQALGIALTGMMNDREITLPRAEAVATQVLRGTAASLYHLDASAEGGRAAR